VSVILRDEERSVAEHADESLRRQVVAEHLTDVSPRRAALRIMAMVAIWCAGTTFGLVLEHWWAWAAAWWVQALCLVGSYSAMHEGTHGTLARSRRWNRLLAGAWGMTILWNAALWRQYHLAHHAHAGTDADPEPSTEASSALAYVTGIPLTGAGFALAQWAISARATVTGFAPAWSRGAGHRAARRNGALLLAWTAALAIAAATEPGLVLRLWLGPYLLAVLLVAPATGITEHYGCERGLGAPDPYASTRTVISNPAVRFLFWQNNFHAAHHAFPTVPAHNAPRLHRLVAGRTVHLASGYVRFHLEVVRRLATRRRTPSASG
jgi:fatty acid desaturase